MRKLVLVGVLALAGCSESTADPILESLRQMDIVGDPSSVQTRRVTAPSAGAGFVCGEVKFIATGGLGWTSWVKFLSHEGTARTDDWSVSTLCEPPATQYGE